MVVLGTWHYTTSSKWNRLFAYFTSENASRPIESGFRLVSRVKNWGYSRERCTFLSHLAKLIHIRRFAFIVDGASSRRQGDLMYSSHASASGNFLTPSPSGLRKRSRQRSAFALSVVPVERLYRLPFTPTRSVHRPLFSRWRLPVPFSRAIFLLSFVWLAKGEILHQIFALICTSLHNDCTIQ